MRNAIVRLILLACAGCGGCYDGERSTYLGSERHQPRPPGAPVQILFNKQEVPGVHEYAIYQHPINVGDSKGLRQYLDFVTQEARRIGCSQVDVQEENTARKSVLTAHFLFPNDP